MTDQAPGLPAAFWRGMFFGLCLSAIAWLVFWRFVLWLML
jgi:hypothetical protein